MILGNNSVISVKINIFIQSKMKSPDLSGTHILENCKKCQKAFLASVYFNIRATPRIEISRLWYYEYAKGIANGILYKLIKNLFKLGGINYERIKT
jgi:hypothetical protein